MKMIDGGFGKTKKVFYTIILSVLALILITINPVAFAYQGSMPEKGTPCLKDFGIFDLGESGKIHCIPNYEKKVVIGNNLVYHDSTFLLDGIVTNNTEKICDVIYPLMSDLKIGQISNVIITKFDKPSYQLEDTAVVWAFFHYKTKLFPSDGENFVCAMVESKNTGKSIPIILKESTIQRGFFYSIGRLLLTSHQKIDSYVFGPNLSVSTANNTTDTVTVTLMNVPGVVRSSAKVDSGSWGIVGGARGQTISYTPSLFPHSETRTTCSTDADKDYVCDSWEPGGSRLAISYGGTTWYGPSCSGTDCPSPSQKDIFVQVDGYTGATPSTSDQTTISSDLKAALLDSTGTRLNGGVGNPSPYYLHIQWLNPNLDSHLDGVGFPSVTVNPPPTDGQNYNDVKATKFATDTGGLSLANAQDRKAQVYHYALFANKVQNDPTSSGVGEYWGDDMLLTPVALGIPLTDLPKIEGTFMHELGHNLNLYHGGLSTDDINCKPNQISVMNYIYQLNDLVGTRKLDYSQWNLGPTSGGASILEGSSSHLVLNEQTGIASAIGTKGAPGDVNRYAAFGTNNAALYDIAQTGGSIDWNYNDATPPNAGNTATFMNINSFPSISGCPSSPLDETLNGHKEWGSPKLNFQASPNFASGVHREHKESDVTLGDHQKMQDMHFALIGVKIGQVSNSGSKVTLNNILNDSINYNHAGNVTAAIQKLDLLNNTLDEMSSSLTSNETKSIRFVLNDELVGLKKVVNYVSVKFNSQTYHPGENTIITVVDPDANRNSTIIDSIIVNISSGHDSNGINLSLIETGHNTGIFQQSANLTNMSSNETSKVLKALSGDTVKARYGEFYANAFVS